MDNTLIAAVLAAGLTTKGTTPMDIKRAIKLYRDVLAELEAQEQRRGHPGK